MNILNKILTDKHVTGQLITTPTLLSQCGTRVTLDEKDKYDIEIEPGDFLVIRMGFNVNKPGASFTHPNIAATSKVVHEFKHYRKNGSKFWTSKAGVDHFFVVPRNKITLSPEKGYSYIKAEINGVKVSFNVSGGGGEVWTDFLNTSTSTSVNHKLKDIKKIAAVAVRNSPLEPITTEELTTEQLERWNELKAKSKPDIKEVIAKMIEEGKKPVIHLITGYNYDKGEAKQVTRKRKRILQPSLDKLYRTYRLEYTGAPQSFILDCGWNGIKVKMAQIDWHKTAVENNIDIH